MTHTYQKTAHRSSLEILQKEEAGQKLVAEPAVSFFLRCCGKPHRRTLSQWLLLPSMTDANRLLIGIVSLSVF